MSSPMPLRDERTISVENASYRWAYLFVTFALLVAVVYRDFFLGQSSWDLFAIIIASGVITTLFQAQQRVFTMRSARTAIVVVAIASVVALVLTVASTSFRAAAAGVEAARSASPR
jgi:hypothetical protein